MRRETIWAAVAIMLVTTFAPPSLADDIPAFPKDATILFQGDSITDGNRGRTKDLNHILGHGYVFIVAAKCGATRPDQDWNFLNRGISGNKVTDLQKRWQADTLDLKPDVLSILIGVNDLSKDVPADEFRTELNTLLDGTTKALPNVKLILCEPFGLPSGAKRKGWDAYRAKLEERQAIVKEIAEQHHAIFVGFQKIFDDACQRAPADYWIWDGIHPTYRGHQLMADEWMRVVAAALK